MNAKKCDRCGANYEEHHTKISAKNGHAYINTLTIKDLYSDGHFVCGDLNLCSKCTIALQEWLKGDKTNG